MAVLLVLALALAGVARAVHARGQAQAAADLAALAGATVLHATPVVDPCLIAHEVAVVNGAELTACEVVSGEVEVRAVTPLVDTGWPGARHLRATAQARAGPA